MTSSLSRYLDEHRPKFARWFDDEPVDFPAMLARMQGACAKEPDLLGMGCRVPLSVFLNGLYWACPRSKAVFFVEHRVFLRNCLGLACALERLNFLSFVGSPPRRQDVPSYLVGLLLDMHAITIPETTLLAPSTAGVIDVLMSRGKNFGMIRQLFRTYLVSNGEDEVVHNEATFVKVRSTMPEEEKLRARSFMRSHLGLLHAALCSMNEDLRILFVYENAYRICKMLAIARAVWFPHAVPCEPDLLRWIHLTWSEKPRLQAAHLNHVDACPELQCYYET